MNAPEPAWLPVLGFPGYEATADGGRCRSYHRFGTGTALSPTPRELTAIPVGRGYLAFNCKRGADGRRTMLTTTVLAALAAGLDAHSARPRRKAV